MRKCESVLDLFNQAGVLDLFNQAGVLDLFNQAGVLDLFNQAGALDLFNQVDQWRQINGGERGLMPTGHRTRVSEKTVPSGAEATNVFSVQEYRIGQRLVILEGIHNGKPLAETRNDMQRRKSITTKIAKEHLSSSGSLTQRVYHAMTISYDAIPYDALYHTPSPLLHPPPPPRAYVHTHTHTHTHTHNTSIINKKTSKDDNEIRTL